MRQEITSAYYNAFNGYNEVAMGELESNLLLGGFSENKFTMILVCFVAGYSKDIPLKLIDKVGSLLDSSKTKEKI